MTGQIPKYGEHFRLERAEEYNPRMSNSIYVLKRDPRWVIRSDKTSKYWAIYFLPNISWEYTVYMNTQTSLGRAMDKLLDGINKGFYLIKEANNG